MYTACYRLDNSPVTFVEMYGLNPAWSRWGSAGFIPISCPAALPMALQVVYEECMCIFVALYTFINILLLHCKSCGSWWFIYIMTCLLT